MEKKNIISARLYMSRFIEQIAKFHSTFRYMGHPGCVGYAFV